MHLRISKRGFAHNMKFDIDSILIRRSLFQEKRSGISSIDIYTSSTDIPRLWHFICDEMWVACDYYVTHLYLFRAKDIPNSFLLHTSCRVAQYAFYALLSTNNPSCSWLSRSKRHGAFRCSAINAYRSIFEVSMRFEVDTIYFASIARAEYE